MLTFNQSAPSGPLMSLPAAIRRFGWRWLAAPLLAAVFILPFRATLFLTAALGSRLPIASYQLPDSPLPFCTPHVVNYDLVYVRAPRYGDNTNSVWPDDVRPLQPDPGSQLHLLHPDCTDELLFPRPQDAALIGHALGNGSVADPNISFDGQWVVFTYYPDQTDINNQRGLSYEGADIYRMNLSTRTVVRLTHQEFTPNLGNGANFDCTTSGTNCPHIGVFNVGPAFVSQSNPQQPAIAFTSSRNNFRPPKAFSLAERTLQLFIMDWDGSNVRQIGYLNNAQALHPFQLRDGRLMFTSWEDQGLRDIREFNLWFIAPDGTQWNSGSGLGENATGHHFMTQMSNGDIVVVRYYNLNNNGFGDLVRYPLDPPGPDFGGIDQPNTYMPFQRPGQVDLTRWTADDWSLAADSPAPCHTTDHIYPSVMCTNGNNSRVGKVTQPAAAPGGNLLLVYTPGAANHNGIADGAGFDQPYYDGGLYFMPASYALTGATYPTQTTEILNDPAYNEQWPRPVVPYAAIFGQSQPTIWPEHTNDGSPNLPANTPLGLIGTSSLIWRDTNPRLGPDYAPDPDPFNTSHEALMAWLHQGADDGVYTSTDIYALRILALLPATDRTYPNDGPNFSSVGNERLRILGEIPVRQEGTIDGNGNVDTSFLAKIPADTPFTFQTLDRNGLVLNMAQTWHQVRPGEARYDCGGCHAHSKTPLDFYTTVAGQPGFVPTDLALHSQLLQVTQFNGIPSVVVSSTLAPTVEYFRDVQPILQNRCVSCHSSDSGPGKLNLSASSPAVNGYPGAYFRLVQDDQAQYGLGVPAGSPQPYFIEPQLTRYMRGFQSRQSLLVWIAFNQRLDGRTNAIRSDDVDYSQTTINDHMSIGLTWDEKLTLARWVDLGAPINQGTPWGWFEDDLRPTLWVAPTVLQASLAPVAAVNIGAYDLQSGLKPNSLHVTLNVSAGGHPAGYNFAAGLNPANGGELRVPLPGPIDLAALGATLNVTISDNVGQVTAIVRHFSPSFTPILRIFAPLIRR